MRSETKAVSGAQKVAAFLLSLDKSAAAAVLKSLDPRVVSEVASAMTELDPKLLDRAAVDALYTELSKTLHTPSKPRAAADGELSTLLESSIGKDKSKSVLNEIVERRRHERPFARIEKMPSAVVGRALREESTAVAALVLAHLEPKFSAEILAAFEPDAAVDVVKRMSQIVPPGFDTLATVADSVEARVTIVGARPSPIEPKERLKTIAQMLSLSQKEVERAVLEGLEDTDQEMVGTIREFMFTWDDLASLDKRGMQKVLSSVETRSLAIGLKGSRPEVEANIMNNLSTRVKAMIVDERELAGALPMIEILASREIIMKAVRGLLESGELSSSKAGEELVA
ncbi:MAG: FliG C-terminal domain-containing protein [Planctomycetota bacterium]|nr:FliG C-terminal domain-containing protein [Planctomycetota bacterium]